MARKTTASDAVLAFREHARAKEQADALLIATVEETLAALATLETDRAGLVAQGADALARANQGGLTTDDIATFLHVDVAALAVFETRRANGRRDTSSST